MTTTDTPRTDAMYETHTSEYQRRLLSEDLERKLHDAEIRIQAEVSRIEMLNRKLAASNAKVERLAGRVKELESVLRQVINTPVIDPAKLIDLSMGQLWDSIADAKNTLNPTNK